jgi:Amt family ammonium transporter
MVALVLPMFLMAGIGWHVWNTYWSFKETQLRDVRLQELYGTMRYLDEILTTSARMGVATGDPHWERRYLDFLPSRNAALTAATQLSPEAFLSLEAAKMNAAKSKIMELERQALSLAREGRREVGAVILFSAQYTELNQLYVDGMKGIAGILQKQAEDALRNQRLSTLAAVAAVCVALPVLIFAWFGVLRMVGRYLNERRKAEEKIKEAMALKYAFTSMVSHELRTPLAAIKEGIDIVRDGTAGTLNEDQKDFLASAIRNVDRLGRLINDVLDYQKLDSGRMEFNMKEHNVNDLVRESQISMESLAQNQGIELGLTLEENLPKFLLDRDRIIQVLFNLINNAIKFTETGSITLVTAREANGVRVSVRDTGIGIRADDIPRLFHSFSQIDDGAQRRTGGTGLGLAISKEIVVRHGGRIWAESVFGRGSTFSFSLPATRRKK